MLVKFFASVKHKSMTLNFEELKVVDSKTKDLVNGFVRKLVNDESTIIPSLVVSICILFYNLKEFFTVCGEGMIIDETATKVTTKEATYGENSCYGNMIVSNEYECVYSWELKRVVTNRCHAVIGIVCDQSRLNRIFTDDSLYFYSFASSGYTLSHEGWSDDKICGTWRAEDIIKISINTKERNFKIKFNDEKEKMAFEDIKFDKETNYSFAVGNDCSSNNINCIELVSFQVTFLH